MVGAGQLPLYFTEPQGPANGPDTMIANVGENDADQGLYIKASASSDGSFTVTNPRNNYSKTYKAK